VAGRNTCCTPSDRYMHNRGLFVPVNHTIAREWYEKAAAKNHSNAWGALAVLIWLGQGVEQNYTAAFEALKRQVCQDRQPTCIARTCVLGGMGMDV